MRWGGRRQGRSTKTFERITRCCRYLQQPSSSTMCWRGKNYLFATEQSTFSSISPLHACRHKISSKKKKKKVPSSSFANGIWHLTHFSLYLSPTWRVRRSMEMPQQLKDKWWTNMIRNGNYAIANFRILRIFVHVLLHFTCHVEFPSLCRLPVGGFINKIKSLNFMETLDFLDYNHQHQQTRNFHARTKN